MVVAQIPLWIQHTTGSSHPGPGTATGTSATLPIHESGKGNATATHTQKTITPPNPWAVTNARRSAIYAVDIALSGNRLATGGGDGKVRIWNLEALFVTHKVADTDIMTASGENEDSTKPPPQAMGAGKEEDDTNRKRMARFGSKGGYESSDSSSGGSSDESYATEKGQGHFNKKRKRTNSRSISGDAETSNTLESPHQLLCTMASHSGSVLTVRFSTSATILASAGDDAHVFLYKQSSTPSISSLGNLMGEESGTQQLEYWERIRICRGHNLDVVGLCWAPDDSHLISCSLDSDTPICVWKVDDLIEDDFDIHDQQDRAGNGIGASWSRNRHHHHTRSSSTTTASILQPYKILGVKEHTSTVKGVAFDPAGKYIASSGDDPSLCIWRAFDDWGLESRIDASSGIFEQMGTGAGAGGQSHGGNRSTMDMDYVQSLSNLSMFRRISFAPDGTHVCTTNATLRKKNIAAMVSRDGWRTGVKATNNGTGTHSGAGSFSTSVTVSGAANLVGHKQPVVSSRHCPYFFGMDDGNTNGDSRKSHENVEPNYSTLVALGDKKGFLTIWSTKRSRPIFKMQCSESRCTVTDITWGLMPSVMEDKKNSRPLVMLVSLLDGFVVALRFDTGREIGPVLSDDKVHDIFRLKYGIDLKLLNGGSGKSRKRLVDDSSGPKLIENVLQYTVEEENDDSGDSDNDDDHFSVGGEKYQNKEMLDEKKDEVPRISGSTQQPRVNVITDVRKKQIESRSKSTGKKRIQPVLMTINGGMGDNSSVLSNSRQISNEQASSQNTKEASFMERGITQDGPRQDGKITNHGRQFNSTSTAQQTAAPYDNVPVVMQHSATSIPASNHKIYTVDLIIPEMSSTLDENGYMHKSTGEQSKKMVASCMNSIHSPPGASGPTSCTTITISRGSNVTWREHLMGAHCTALDACSSLLAIGSYDGTIYFYSTSPSLGWESGIGFRSHPPFVMGGSIVRLSLKESEKMNGTKGDHVEMLVVTSDGLFYVYTMLPSPKLQYKGSILPAMNQMRLSASLRSSQKKNDSSSFPELARIMFTEAKHLLLILCHKTTKGGTPMSGLLQGFIYNRDMEAWMRVSDGRFMFSKLFSTVPSSKLSNGLLAKIDHTVRTTNNGVASNSRRGIGFDVNASAMYYINEDDKQSLQSFSTRSHCQDRLACAMALKSKPDVEHWLRLYVRNLCIEADTVHLRLIVDMLLDRIEENFEERMNYDPSPCWWLSSATSILGLDRKGAIKNIIIPEMAKNRALQRLTNEFSTEMKSLK